RTKRQRATSGVGVAINDKYEQNIESIEYVCDRILRVNIMFDQPIHIISVYATDINKPEEMSMDFYENLQSAIDKIPRHEKIILLGDLNARIGNENELRINNTYFPHKEQHKYTFYDNRNNKSIIDYIITNRSFLPQQIIDIRVLSSANIGTDHKLMLGKIRIGAPLSKKRPSIKTEKFNIESLNHESTKQLYSNRCQTLVTLNPIAQFDTPNTAWNKLKENICKGAKEALGTRTVSHNRRPNIKPWFTLEVKNITREMKEKYLQYKKSLQHRRTEIFYTEIRNRTNNRVRKLKKNIGSDLVLAKWRRICTEHKKRIGKMLRGLKRETNETIQLRTIAEDMWEKYFQRLIRRNR
ncbi:craniofacial development protein 2-like, partial [Sitophilus oryzae]|uniref:Craniofacial development protein 2-like n=1 Tax=Sitophilus oryzae TaxID=7048 RepID=A0A6J2Y548_SITOR